MLLLSSATAPFNKTVPREKYKKMKYKKKFDQHQNERRINDEWIALIAYSSAWVEKEIRKREKKSKNTGSENDWKRENRMRQIDKFIDEMTKMSIWPVKKQSSGNFTTTKMAIREIAKHKLCFFLSLSLYLPPSLLLSSSLCTCVWFQAFGNKNT